MAVSRLLKHVLRKQDRRCPSLVSRLVPVRGQQASWYESHRIRDPVYELNTSYTEVLLFAFLFSASKFTLPSILGMSRKQQHGASGGVCFPDVGCRQGRCRGEDELELAPLTRPPADGKPYRGRRQFPTFPPPQHTHIVSRVKISPACQSRRHITMISSSSD